METVKKLFTIDSTYLPCFKGFYGETLEQSKLEDRIWIWEAYMGENEMEPRELEDWEWKDAGVEFAKDYCRAFEREASEWCEAHQVTIEFVQMYSPKYYNYTTDTIWIKVVSEFKTWDEFRDSLEKWIEAYNSENKNYNFDCVILEAMD